MKHPIDHHLEYFAFTAPDGVCVVVMLRGVWVEALDGLSPRHLTCARLQRVVASLRGEVRRQVDRASRHIKAQVSSPPPASPAR